MDYKDLKNIIEVLNHQQKAIDMAIGHFRALYTTQQFVFSIIAESSPEIKAYLCQALEQVLVHPGQLHEYPEVLQSFQDLKNCLQQPAARTPEERRARLYLAWPPKLRAPEKED